MNLATLKESLCRLPFVGVVVRAYLKGDHDYAKDMAASAAYFTFFSLFPLILGIVAVGSLFLDSAEIQARVDRLLVETLPGSADFVRDNLEALTRLRGVAGVASVVGLFWSASRMFGALSRGINRALDLKRPHPSYLSRLRSLLLTVTVSVLMFLSLAVSTGVELLPGALFAAFLFEVGKTGFVLYIENVAHLEAVYGSLSSIIVLLLWLYFSARVLLLGAELIAVRRQDRAPGRT
jgi:membrane protein